MDTQKTKVIFRKFPEVDILAIFPELPGARHFCLSYMQIGQHSDCDPVSCIAGSKLATEQEYKPLYDELTSIGYNLQVCKRYAYAMQCNRIAELKRMNNEADRLYDEQESNYLHSIGG